MDKLLMKPWQYINNAQEVRLPSSVLLKLDSFEKEIDVLAYWGMETWVDGVGLTHMSAYLLTESKMLVATVNRKEDTGYSYLLSSYPLKYLARVERGFLFDENTSMVVQHRLMWASLTLHFTTDSGMEALTIPGPASSEAHRKQEYLDFCAKVCQHVG